MVRIVSAKPLKAFRALLGFSDGTTREFDLELYLTEPIFDSIRSSPEAFREISLDPELGTVVWPNGADLDPDVLYLGQTPAAWEIATPGGS